MHLETATAWAKAITPLLAAVLFLLNALEAIREKRGWWNTAWHVASVPASFALGCYLVYLLMK